MVLRSLPRNSRTPRKWSASEHNGKKQQVKNPENKYQRRFIKLGGVKEENETMRSLMSSLLTARLENSRTSFDDLPNEDA